MLGETLLHYEIDEKIGAGGMGEVFAATDTKLRRRVALKFLPPELTGDQERLQRFEREARVLAALNHPHIGVIHGLEHADGRTFLVLELIEGRDLAEVLRGGPLDVDEAVRLGRQIADALEAAHELGIVHRDLKPANVKLTPEGNAKVLDFGLAKALDVDDGDSSLTAMPTRTSGRTLPGVVMGTAAYMSPEQARGGSVDRRADIWAFGVVMFELLAAGRVFGGETVSDVLASVLKTDPDWDALPADAPPALERLLRRCLERDPRRRLRDIGEARLALEAVAAGETGEAAAAAPGRGGLRTALLAAVFSGVLLGMVGFLAGSRAVPEAPVGEVRRFDVASAHEPGGGFAEPAVSPDGRRVAYVFDGSLWVRDLDRLEPRRLPSTEGALTPFWSPDGREIAFLAGTNLWRIPVEGGRRQLVCDLRGNVAGGRGGWWAADGTIVFSRGNSGIYSAPAVGGDAREIIAVAPETEGDLHEPSVLPDGGILFVVHPDSAGPGVLAVQYGDERTVLLDLAGHRILDPRYVATGHIVYERTGQSNDGIWALPYDLAGRRTTGEPVLIVPDAAEATVSADGQLVYLNAQASGEEQMVILDASGAVVEEVTDPSPGLGAPCLSPDGTRLALAMSDGEEVDVWVQDLRRGTRSRLTHDGADVVTSWFPDGERFVFHSVAAGAVMTRTTDNTAAPERLVEGFGASVSPDGRHVLLVRANATTGRDVFVLDLEEEGAEAAPLVAGPRDDDFPAFAPDGRHFAYVSDETGRREVFLREFPSGARPVQVSIAGADQAEWSVDGTRIYLLSSAGIREVEVAPGADGRVELGRPRLVFAAEGRSLHLNRGFDVDADGRFVMVRGAVTEQSDTSPGVVLVENWTGLLRAH